MGRVAIVTDSTACLPRNLADKWSIKVVPLSFVFSDASYSDDPDLDMSEFYRRLKEAEKPPTTSPASPGMYLEVFRELSAEADGILCITVTSRISGMFEAARVAKEMAAEYLPNQEIRVLDSGTATMAQGFVALAAARAAARGESLERVCKEAEDVKAKVGLVAMVDTLYYLARSGRFPRLAAWGASLIGLKPILTLRQGQVRPVSATRSARGGIGRMLKIMREHTRGGGPVHASVFHTDAPGEADKFMKRVGREIDCAELYLSHFTPVMGIYTGPGVLGLAYYAE